MTGNRRITSRDEINIIGKVIILRDGSYVEEIIDIINISMDGIQIVFANNTFLFYFLPFVKEPDKNILIEFDFKDIQYKFEAKINWLKIFNFSERNYYALTGLTFKNKELINEKLLDLLLDLQMKEIYLG